MPLFKATVIQPDGTQTLSIQARDKAEAYAFAQQLGAVVVIHRQWEMTTALSTRERELFLTKLASLLSSRVGLGRALRLIAEEFDGRIRRVAQAILQDVEGGAGLEEALEAHPDEFPASVVALVRAGIRAGNTARALETAAHFERDLQGLRQVAGKGLLNALIGFISALVVVVYSTYWLGPEMSTAMGGMMDGGEVDIGWALTAGYALTWGLVALAATLAVLFLVSTVGRKLNPLGADSVTRAVPLWRGLRLGKERFLGLHALSALIGAGLPLEQALRRAADTLPQGRLSAQLRSAAEAVEQGAPWANQLTDLDRTDRAALVVASDKQQITQILARQSAGARNEFLSTTEIFVVALQGISALALTAGGGLLFAVSILPMLKTSSKLLGG